MARKPMSPEVRQLISESIKRAYREGRLTSPSKRPDVRKKLSRSIKRAIREGRVNIPVPDAKARAKAVQTIKEHGGYNWTKRPEVREKIRATLKRKYASGEIVSKPHDPAHAWPNRKGVKLPTSQKEQISERVKQAWAEGRYKSRKGRDPNKPSITEELIMDQMLDMGFKSQFKLRKPGAETSMRGDFYYYDFGSAKVKLLIEIDSENHKQTGRGRRRDRAKQRLADNRGYKILRFTNKAVLFSPGSVVALIRLHV